MDPDPTCLPVVSFPGSLPMKIYEPIAISLFTVLVLSATFMVGKHVGYTEGLALSEQSIEMSVNNIEQAAGIN